MSFIDSDMLCRSRFDSSDILCRSRFDSSDVLCRSRFDSSDMLCRSMFESIMIITECEALEATCSESLSSVSFTWQPFNDEESGIVRYFIILLS